MVDTVKVGHSLRALRRRRAWTQQRLAKATGVDRSTISRIEAGSFGSMRLSILEKVANAFGAQLDLGVRWNGEGIARLLDESHATVVDSTLSLLRTLDWEVAPEVSFSVFGERGSIDVLAYHRSSSILLVVEVKSVVPDLQAMLSALDRKARLAPTIGRDRGWIAGDVGRLLVLSRSATTYRRLARHSPTLDVAFPSRGSELRRWLRDPARPAVSGLLVVSSVHGMHVRNRAASRERLREVAGSAARVGSRSAEEGRAPGRPAATEPMGGSVANVHARHK